VIVTKGFKVYYWSTEVGFVVVDTGYLGEPACYKSCLVLDERAFFEFCDRKPIVV
jgi:hypothetical protein